MTAISSVYSKCFDLDNYTYSRRVLDFVAHENSARYVHIHDDDDAQCGV